MTVDRLESSRVSHELDVFFNPKSVAIVGASRRKGSVGRAILENMMRSYKGKIYPVNPKYDEILGLKAFPRLTDIPEDVDLAVIAVRAELVPAIMEDAAAKGVRGVVIVSAGFAEVGEEGKRLQDRILEIARRHGIRVVGPNCIGVYSALTGVDTFFMPWERMKRPHKGPIAIISQSGAFLTSVMDWAAEAGIGISKAVNFGNKIDVDEVDLLEYFGEDYNVRVIIVYLEGVSPGRGRELIRVARKVTLEKGKHILLLKGGKTSSGARAAASHTAALAGSYEVFRAAMKQANIIEVDDIVTLFDMAKALALLRTPKGRRVGVVTNAGGLGVIASDNLVKYGLEVPHFSERLRARLRELFPPRAAVGNPVDLTGDARDEDFKKALEALINSDEVDMILVIVLMQPPTLTLRVVDYIAEESHKRKDKPVVVATAGSEYAWKLREYLESRGIPVYEFPERAARALYALARRAGIPEARIAEERG
ncbi:acetate--CoA ligase family protein [Stetteria hydrogenophila]